MKNSGFDHASAGILAALACFLSLALAPSAVAAKDDLPSFSLAVRDTLDGWEVPMGTAPGTAILNKLQVMATVGGDPFGLPGWSVHGQVFRFDGQALSSRMGDIQTADNLEAVPVTRLFEAWLQKRWGGTSRSVSLRAGLIDLNSQFDSIDPAGLFLNSSHGIGPDLSRSGISGPSIYPVSALGAAATIVPSARWTIRAAVFDGVAGDPERPHAFVSEQLGRHDGVLAIVQADYQLSKDYRIEAGAWGYSASFPAVDGGRAHDHGVYASVEGPLPILPRLSGWLRAGFAGAHAQAVRAYLGVGAVQNGTFKARPEDRLGVAIAHAILGEPAVLATGVSHAETSVEVTYQLKITDTAALQPEFQYIVHPAGVAAAPDALGLGLRIVLTTGFPRKAKATDGGDPTVPADGAPTTAPDDSSRPG